MSIWRALKFDRPTNPIWFGDEDSSALIELQSGRVIGRFEHDGFGKWDIAICTTYWQAWRIVRREPAGWLGLASFPYCWIWLYRAKSVEAAYQTVMNFAGPVWFEWDVHDEEECEHKVGAFEE